MPTNIVLCSDGTGNRGGKGHGTNVWRLYNAIDQHHAQCRQIAFYDDGVGTDENDTIRAITGATGWGFTRNVKDLYAKLVRTWQGHDDDIYLFGFSRGAYTVRALAAFITTCGIIEHARSMPAAELSKKIDELVDDYHTRGKRDIKAFSKVATLHPVKVACVGVWDTVSAIGLPFDFFLKDLILRFFKFRFDNYNLSRHVIRGYQALALDDERRSFHPCVWNESQRDNVEQVWFSGVHANVGGGYPKQALSLITLVWMLEHVKCHQGDGHSGLLFEEGFEAEIQRQLNPHGRLYDSRAGSGGYYRYSPREVDRFADVSEIGVVKIHEGVFDRMERRADAYDPGVIPFRHRVQVIPWSEDSRAAEIEERLEVSRPRRKEIFEHTRIWIERRQANHLAIVLTSIMVAAGLSTSSADLTGYLVPAVLIPGFTMLAVGLRKYRYQWQICTAASLIVGLFAVLPQLSFHEALVASPITARIMDGIAWVIDFVVPDVFMGGIQKGLRANPFIFPSALLGLSGLLLLKGRLSREIRKRHEEACDAMRPALR